MKYIEYGKGNGEVIMMLHGGGLSWWNYRKEAELLCDKYHVILPVIDGHADSESRFESIEIAAGKLIDYIRDYCNGKIKALCGLSLGAQIVVEMLSQANSICDYALIESASLIPSKFINKLIGPIFSISYGLINQKWFSKLQFRSLHINSVLYEDYYRDTCLITKRDMIAFLKANTEYSLCDSIKNTNAIVKVVVGEKEQASMIESAKKISAMLPNVILDVKSGLYHGEYSLNMPERYVKELKELMDRTNSIFNSKENNDENRENGNTQDRSG